MSSPGFEPIHKTDISIYMYNYKMGSPGFEPMDKTDIYIYIYTHLI